jgi:hypothetical protein
VAKGAQTVEDETDEEDGDDVVVVVWDELLVWDELFDCVVCVVEGVATIVWVWDVVWEVVVELKGGGPVPSSQ